MKELRILLYPLSLIYGAIMWLRNQAFEAGLVKSHRFHLPVISVGNLSMGGTGKTPHVEYLVRLLKDRYQVATLSRGYKRQTTGFIIAENSDHAEAIGDEPMQYKRKFPELIVAVDEDRCHGIRHLMNRFPDLDVILLDDAFQHRRVVPGFNILLTDYLNPFHKDYVFPAGSLREFKCGANRADVIIVTKTPKVFSPITRRTMAEEINCRKDQQLMFSYISYVDMKPVFPENQEEFKSRYNTILLIAGIANTYPLEIQLKEYCMELEVLKFPDHHQYLPADIDRIKQTFCNIVSRNKAIVTTEKDAVRLMKPGLSEEISDLPVFYVPIEIEFHKTDKEIFDTQIINYVEKNKRNH